MSDTLNQSASTPYAVLVEFLWGESNAHAARYTSYTDPVTIGGNVFATTATLGPKIETRILVEPSLQTGGVKDEPWQITMVAVPPLTYIARPYAWAPVTVNIFEVDPTAVSPVPTQLWTGTATNAAWNLKAFPNCIKAEISGWRVGFQYPLGVESKTGCIRVFGDPWCGVNLAPLQQTATITAINGNVISAPTLTQPRTNHFGFGRVYIDGLTIGIADGTAGVSSLKLLQPPPPEWLGASARFTPGCDHTQGGGCTFWNNVGRYAGFGQRKPSGSPSISPR